MIDNRAVGERVGGAEGRETERLRAVMRERGVLPLPHGSYGCQGWGGRLL